MHYTEIKKQQGFTLIEVLVVVPTVMLMIAIIVGYVVYLTGDALKSQARSKIIYDTQTALDRIEQDARLSTKFLPSLTVNSPQGPGAGGATGTFSSSTALVLEQNATTTNPYDISRQLIYLADKPNPCALNKQFNTTLKTNVVYFLQNGSLWRRVIVPTTGESANPCDKPWQRNTCPSGFNASTICRGADELILPNTDSLSLTYYASASSSVALPSNRADESPAILVKLSSSNKIAGSTISHSGLMRTTHVNTDD